MPLPLGTIAPDFELPSQGGETVSLRDVLKERAAVLFFYPKDFTPGCTAESCAFRDQYDVFVEAGAEVIGISRDSVDSHQAFASKHDLHFRVLSDPDGRVASLFRVRPSIPFLVPGRATYVIDREGVIRHHFASQLRPQKHVREALEVVRTLAAERQASDAKAS